MDWEDLVQVIDNYEPAYRRVERLAVDADTPEELGDMIRDMIREGIPEDGGLADLLWSQAQQGIVYRRVGEYFWDTFRDDDPEEIGINARDLRVGDRVFLDDAPVEVTSLRVGRSADPAMGLTRLLLAEFGNGTRMEFAGDDRLTVQLPRP